MPPTSPTQEALTLAKAVVGWAGARTSRRAATAIRVLITTTPDTHAPLYSQPRSDDDPDPDRGGGAGVLHPAGRTGRRGGSEAARRWRQPYAGDDRGRAQ